jgi:hypothetical protein
MILDQSVKITGGVGLRQAIEGPARQSGYQVKPSLHEFAKHPHASRQVGYLTAL